MVSSKDCRYDESVEDYNHVIYFDGKIDELLSPRFFSFNSEALLGV